MQLDNQEPAKSQAGRKTLYWPQLIDELLGYIEDGLNIKSACAAAGVSVSTFRDWRAQFPGLEDSLNAAREKMRAKILAQIKAAGAGNKGDWKALAEYLRLSFPELRFGNSQQVNVAIQNSLSLEERDPERAKLIAQLEEARARALANKSGASDAREVAEEAERRLATGEPLPQPPEPERLREKPPRNVVERAEWREAQRRAYERDEVDELLDG